ncbi:nucleoside/nucleotide kinase family protein [Hydrogenophaga sp. 5NK40-0174]|uniref:nucleoside/nucleotide kinase family protein n=1 Tax=Hydrogenophaga sp. 5NK40-0174 TaxID=3127649 RepID=UPI00333E534B
MAAAVRTLRSAVPPQGRFILGLAGAPGAGKSTLAEALCEALGAEAALVPMDGFHLANAELARLGRAGRKGAPDTFDAAGYAALLSRLRSPEVLASGQTVYAPAFHREIEEPIAGEIPVTSSARILITEGNYLLLDDPAWRGVAGLLDQVWYVEAEDDALRQERLLARHIEFGRNPDQAKAWITGTDDPNARRIEATRKKAHKVFRWGTGFVR